MKTEDIEKILYSLSSEILAIDWQNKVNIDLYTGSMGEALCYAVLCKYTSNTLLYEDYVYHLVNKSLNNLDSLQGKSSLSGYSGILWGIVYLVNIELLSYQEVETYLDKLKLLVVQSIVLDVDQRNYDLMHGLIGKLTSLIALYECIPQKHIDLPLIIEKGVLSLIEMRIEDKTTSDVFWQSAFKPNGIINLGMAHGVASIIWFLAHLPQKSFLTLPTKIVCIDLMKKASSWLIRQKKTSIHTYFCIPQDIAVDQSKKTNHFSLAWCHGDLGVAIALIRAGNILNDQFLIQEGIVIAKNVAYLPLETSTILYDDENIDNSLCHGALGVFFIFYQLYRLTNDKSLEDAYQYWLQMSLDFLKPEEKFMGLKTALLEPDRTIIWQQSSGLLNGVSGNLLIFLTYVMQEKSINLAKTWFDIFL